MENTIIKTVETVSMKAKNIVGHNLLVTQTTETSENVYVVNARTGEEVFQHRKNVKKKKEVVEYTLTPISRADIADLRKGDKNGVKHPIFLYKEQDNFYYTEITAKLHVTDLMNNAHQCANSETDCKRLASSYTSKGGCRKVLDQVLKIENYPFIIRGYQIFNTKDDKLVVIECKYFDPILQKQVGNAELLKELISSKVYKDFKNFKKYDNDNNDDDDDFLPDYLK